MSVRQEMLAYFEEPEVHAKILEYVQANNLDIEDLDEDQLLRILNELQLLDNIQNKIQQEQASNEPLQDMPHSLTFSITKGRKFGKLLDLQRPSSFYFILCGFSQKVRSASYPVAETFAISQKMTINLKTSQLKSTNNENLQLMVMVVSPGDKKTIYALKLVEWRFVLAYGSLSIDLEMAPYHHEGTTVLPSVGIISVTMKIHPLPKHFYLAEGSLNRQLELEQKEKEFSNNKFYAYANTYWNEIKNVHRSFQTRRVPIYAQTEDKVYVALPKLIKPLYGVRGIDSPHHALRFCSLIPFLENEMNREKTFRRFSTMLASQAGLAEDHCHLLCSLLLGMGLKAYVCVGATSKGEHCWVMTEMSSSITFWECTKGLKLDFFSPKALTYYKVINAVYNNKDFYANIQLDDSISGTKFDFKNGTLWKKMDESVISELQEFNQGISLSYPTINSYAVEQNIEKTLFKLIAEHRGKHKLSFNEDEILSSLLTTALTNYESERVTGQTFCEEEFQTSVKGYILAKHTFKAFPIQLTSLDPNQIMAQLLDQQEARSILLTKGESVFFGVRSKLVVFPDNVFALWISLAIRYYRLD